MSLVLIASSEAGILPEERKVQASSRLLMVENLPLTFEHPIEKYRNGS